MRLISYAIFSIMAAAVVVAHAYQQRREFFTVVVHLSTSKISVALLGNAMLAIMLCLGSTVQALFFGKLREAEVERLWDKIKSSLFETCFAVTMFRDDIGSSFLLNFLGLLVLKWFHWLCHFRGEFMSQLSHDYQPKLASFQPGIRPSTFAERCCVAIAKAGRVFRGASLPHDAGLRRIRS